jgi:hypothetical protein
LLLTVAFIRGILYLAVVPPWQHYDEPTHFEYLRLVALRRHIPELGEYDLELRRDIAASMEATDFWENWGSPPFGYWDDEPPYIGVSELSHPPLYYIFQALPQALVAHQSVDLQLYVARLGSVFLYVVVVASAYGTVAEAFPQRRWLPLAVATFIALLPPFTDLMSGVNNDAGAAAVTSLFLWSSVRMARRGPTLEGIGLSGVLAVLCVVTKSTAGVVAIAVMLALWLMRIPPLRRKWLWIALAFLIPAAGVLLFTTSGQAAYWHSGSEPSAPNSLRAEAPLGNRVFVLSADGHNHPSSVFQELNHLDARALLGNSVTLGAWLKASDGPGGFATLSLYDGHKDQRLATKVSGDWEFYAFTATIGMEAPGVIVRAGIPDRSDAASEIHVDGMVLVDGEMPIGQPHRFTTTHGEQGQWGPYRFNNLLRNGSAEITWPGFRPWAGAVQIYQKPAAWILQSLLDWRRTSWVYGRELWVLLLSFWGKFAWSHLQLPGMWFYPLTALTLVALGGAASGLVLRCRSKESSKPWQRRVWVIFGVSLLAGWGGAILRIHPVFTTWQVFWPVARYAAVVIVPTATVLCVGLAELLPRRWLPPAAWVGLLGLLTLDAVALWKVILPYYYG